MERQSGSEWLTVAAVATRLQTTTWTVTWLIKTGQLPALYLSKRQGWRVRRADVDAMTTPTTQQKAQEPA